jgi:hypothetical protein
MRILLVALSLTAAVAAQAPVFERGDAVRLRPPHRNPKVAPNWCSESWPFLATGFTSSTPGSTSTRTR